MSVLLQNRQRVIRFHAGALRRAAQAALAAAGISEAELSVLLVSDRQIARLHQAYLRKPGPTNVIAFPMGEGRGGTPSPGLLGDVVISVETARREARLARRPLQEHLVRLLIHGLLHLLGYVHDRSRPEARAMQAREQRLVAAVLRGLA
ncbi:MAG: rRNA maturation RNase YbeY [Deltaproteobacteria bacterium]|nr:rRNA maturation RNase YbeY [Deltaproteobacteria bacterium]MBI3076412.1 rRNA maturation RNase YbeY [Deltaproteobacteria bacterium]